jgi:hypothetical protein
MEKLSKLFINDALDTKISLLSDKKNIQAALCGVKLDEMGLFTERKFF